MSKLYNTARPYIILTAIVLISTFIAWLPFLLRIEYWFGLHIPDVNMGYMYRNYDGLLYIVPAKTLYIPEAINSLRLENGLPNIYYAAHLPLYPILIRGLSLVFGYIHAMIFINIFLTVALSWLFYAVIYKLKISAKPLLLSIVFLFLARFFVVRVVGAPESLFLLLIVGSLYFFETKKYFLAGLLGLLSVMTKSPGLLLFAAYFFCLFEHWKKTKKLDIQWLSILLIPLGFVIVCGIYAVQYNDLLAYFHSGDNIHFAFPFSIFNFQKQWIGTAWLEDIVFYFFLYGYVVITLFRSQYRSFFWFALVFFIALINVQHRDIARYSLPLWPLACIAFERFFTDKKFIIIFIILLPAIFLYAWNMLVFNVMPVSNWAPFL